MLPLRAAALALCAAALAAAGCGSEEQDAAPAACLAGSDAYLQALEAAPGEVRLEGETPISDCLVPEQSGGNLAQVGKEMVDAATDLNTQAQRDPTGPAAIRLGYLIGAAEKGQDAIHADLVRRLNTAARFSPQGLLPAEFERTFGEGYAAGKDSG